MLSAVVSFLTRTTQKDARPFELETGVALQLGLACYRAGLVALVWLALDPVMEKEDRGCPCRPSGVVFGNWVDGQSLREARMESHSLDVDSKASPTICADICAWEPLPKFAPGYFDMIWASPVCTEHSRVLTRRPRRLEEGGSSKSFSLASEPWRIRPRACSSCGPSGWLALARRQLLHLRVFLPASSPRSGARQTPRC